MLPILAHVTFFAGVVGLEVWARKKTLSARRKTTVSSLPNTSFSPPRIVDLATKANFGVITANFAVSLLANWPPYMFALATILYVVTRLALLRATTQLAQSSYVMRYAAALAHPKVKRARMALYFTEPRLATPYQATMWLEPLLALGEPFVILLKERKHLKHFPKSDLYEVLLVSNMPAHTPFLPENTSVVFYVNNCMANLNVVKNNPQATHVQLLHGDSDKPPSYNPMTGVYDQIFVAGEMAIDRYARNGVSIAPEKFRIVGRPQLTPPSNTPSRNTTGRKTVVYMPTWAGMFEDSNFCSLPQAHDILHHTFHSGHALDVVFKPHPVSFRDPSWAEYQAKIAAVAANLPDNVTFRLAEMSEEAFDLYEQADVLITDISSTVIDYLHTGKPYIVTNLNAYSSAQLEAYPSVKGGNLLTPDASNLPELLEDCLGPDLQAKERAALRLYAFGDFGRPQGEAFQNACRALLAETTSMPAKREAEKPAAKAA